MKAQAAAEARVLTKAQELAEAEEKLAEAQEKVAYAEDELEEVEETTEEDAFSEAETELTDADELEIEHLYQKLLGLDWQEYTSADLLEHHQG